MDFKSKSSEKAWPLSCPEKIQRKKRRLYYSRYPLIVTPGVTYSPNCYVLQFCHKFPENTAKNNIRPVTSPKLLRFVFSKLLYLVCGARKIRFNMSNRAERKL